MKKRFYIAATLLTLAACTRETDIGVPTGKMIITARTETSADTKTVVEGKTHVFWEPGDEIKVFSGEKSGEFVTDITEPSSTATFVGAFDGDSDVLDEGRDLWAVYPFSWEASFYDETITAVLPSYQEARAGSFANDANLAVAHSTSGKILQFYNVGGGIRFCIINEGIKRILFEGLSGEYVSGKVTIGFDEKGFPEIREIVDGCKFISLSPPEGQESFQPGTWYYIVALPGALEKGHRIRFYKGPEEKVFMKKAFGKPRTIKRSVYGTIQDADSIVIYENISVHFPEMDAIDLGLSVRWGTCNLGAKNPEDFGDYFAWGETEPYYEPGYAESENPIWKPGKEDGYDWDSYRWCKRNEWKTPLLTKYCTEPSLGYDNFTDGKTVLDKEDDAANRILGGKWRMPTYDELKELLSSCDTELAGSAVEKLVGPNGQSIILPRAGYRNQTFYTSDWYAGLYWSSTLNTEYPYMPRAVYFSVGTWPIWPAADEWSNETRVNGLSIRPVYDE